MPANAVVCGIVGRNLKFCENNRYAKFCIAAKGKYEAALGAKKTIWVECTLWDNNMYLVEKIRDKIVSGARIVVSGNLVTNTYISSNSTTAVDVSLVLIDQIDIIPNTRNLNDNNNRENGSRDISSLNYQNEEEQNGREKRKTYCFKKEIEESLDEAEKKHFFASNNNNSGLAKDLNESEDELEEPVFAQDKNEIEAARELHKPEELNEHMFTKSDMDELTIPGILNESIDSNFGGTI